MERSEANGTVPSGRLILPSAREMAVLAIPCVARLGISSTSVASQTSAVTITLLIILNLAVELLWVDDMVMVG